MRWVRFVGAAYGSGQNSTMLIASPPSSRHRTTPINTAQWQGSVENRSASGDDCPPCRAVANVYIERFRPGVLGSNCGSVICFERNSCCWHAICELPSDRPVGSVPASRRSSSRSRLNCTTTITSVIRRLASLPMPKSRSRSSCDINLRNDTSGHRRHTHHCRSVRAKTTDSIHRMPRAVWRRSPAPAKEA